MGIEERFDIIIEQLNAIKLELAELREEFPATRIAVSKTEASKLLEVTRPTVYKMIEDGRLSTTRDGKKVTMESIRVYLMGGTNIA